MTAGPKPSTDRVLEMVQHTLTAAVSIVVAIAVVVAFIKVVRADDSPSAIPTTIPQLSIPPTTEGDGGVTPTITAPEVTTTTGVPARCERTEPEAGRGNMVLRVFMSCGSSDAPNATTYVFREVEQSDALLTNTMHQLVAGASAEEIADGFSTLWSSDTANVIGSVQLADGATIVQFNRFDALAGIDEEPTKSFFLADILASLFQYERVASVELRIGSDCDEFWQMVGESGCRVVTRADWETMLEEWVVGSE
jgi:hypothetical protein